MEVLVANYGRTYAEESAVLEHLAEQAKNHTGAASKNLLGDVPVDPQRYPSQHAFYLGNNNPIRDPDMLELITMAAKPGFSMLQEAFDAWDEKTGTIKAEAENLKKGMNLLVGTNHSTLSDTGFVADALAIKFGRLHDRDLQRFLKITLFMSKIVAFMGLNISVPGEEPQAFPATEKVYETTLPETLSNLLCDHILLSIPQTESLKEGAKKSTFNNFFKIFKSFTDIHNGAVIDKQKELFDIGGVVATVALSGTRDKTLAEMIKSSSEARAKPTMLDSTSGKPASKVVRLGPVMRGTAKMMMDKRTKVLPVAVLMDSDKPQLEVCGIPQAVNSPEAADDIMFQICARLNTMDTARKFEYYTYAELIDRGEVPGKSTDSAY